MNTFWCDEQGDEYRICSVCGVAKPQLQLREIKIHALVQRCGPEVGKILDEWSDVDSVVQGSWCYSCYRKRRGPDSLSMLGITNWCDEIIDPLEFADDEELSAWKERKREFYHREELRVLAGIMGDMFD